MFLSSVNIALMFSALTSPHYVTVFGLHPGSDFPFYSKWWFLIPFFIFLAVLFQKIIRITSKFNQDLAENFSENNYPESDLLIYFLYLGLIFPLAEILYILFSPRAILDFGVHVFMGVISLSIYFLNKKSTFIKFNLGKIQLVLFLFFSAFIFGRLLFGHYDIILYAEITMLFYYAFIAFKKVKHYSIYVVTSLFLLVLSLYFNKISTIEIVTLMILFIVILLINYARRFGTLTINEKYIF